MACCLVIRRARAEDEDARAALLRDAVHEHFTAAFLIFFFNELTLQCAVVCGAVLFIFCGASVAACGCVVPAAAGVVACGVRAAHALAAERQARALRGELAGWVAEAAAARLVGTVSLSEWWGPEPRGWLHALAVARAWRRRGAARALAGAASGAAAAAGLHSLEAAASGAQEAGRAALHAAGWALRGSYSRPLLGAALTLPMVQLGVDLPVPRYRRAPSAARTPISICYDCSRSSTIYYDSSRLDIIL